MRILRLAFPIMLWTVAAHAQVIPGRYIVELTGAPLGAEVRTKGRAALRDKAAQIQTEQARVRPLIERHRAKVLSSMDSLFDALIITAPDSEAAAIAAIPGVKKVYPVYQYTVDLDHALPIHNVPDAWNNILGGQARAGAGIKIAILDTGISPKLPAFQDSTLIVPPGFPLASSTANMALTTNKIIVARSYENIYMESTPMMPRIAMVTARWWPCARPARRSQVRTPPSPAWRQKRGSADTRSCRATAAALATT